ncbi:MAG: hypothetical protein ABH843_05865 [Candidatus Omnitrophota bacterium]
MAQKAAYKRKRTTDIRINDLLEQIKPDQGNFSGSSLILNPVAATFIKYRQVSGVKKNF